MTIESLAKLCHEVNRSFCEAIGDNSQTSWETAPDWQKESSIRGVKFHLGNPDAGPEHSHNEWLFEKYANGWKYGPIKDASKKEHPCCVPYEELPEEQKAKDKIFLAIVNASRPLIPLR